MLKRLPVWAAAAAILSTVNMLMKHGLIVVAAITNQEPVLGELIRFYSYFTNWSNLVCCLFFWGLALPKSRLGHYAYLPGVRSALATYMIIVAAVYHALLAGLWEPKGLTRLADLMFHSFVPLWVLLIWLVFGEPKRVRYHLLWRYLLLPLLYLAYALLRGTLTGFYPYFFLDIDTLGLASVAVNILLLLAAFLGLGFVLTALANCRHRRFSAP